MNDPRTLLARARAAIREIDAATLAGDIDRFMLVDVRAPEETAQGIIPGAACLPMDRLVPGLGDAFDPAAAESLRAETREICVYCHSGARSAIVAYVLQRSGIDAVVSLAGGIVAWEALDEAARPPSGGGPGLA